MDENCVCEFNTETENNANIKKLLLLLLLVRRRKSKVVKKRRFWVREIFQNRKQQGDYFQLMREMEENDEEKFFNYLRMTKHNFEKLHSIVGAKITKIHCVREPISSKERLAITLRYLASGDSMISISFAFRVSHSSISGIIRECCNAIWDSLSGTLLLAPNEENWKIIANDFAIRWNLPHCVGALDGKHVVIQAPPNSGSTYYNYKSSHSIVLMALCDARYRFTMVDIGAEGRHSDGGIFKNSNLGKRVLSSNLSFPPPIPLTPSGNAINYFIAADEAFPLTTCIMRPYPGRYLTQDKRVFNYRLSRGRRMIENVFGGLASRWRIFRRPIIGSDSTVTAIIKACVCLHNYCISCKGNRYAGVNFFDRETANGEVIPGDWRNEERTNLLDISRTGSNMYGRPAVQMRDSIAAYFMNEGSVSFQWGK